jgi:hypothetical protein
LLSKENKMLIRSEMNVASVMLKAGLHVSVRELEIKLLDLLLVDMLQIYLLLSILAERNHKAQLIYLSTVKRV